MHGMMAKSYWIPVSPCYNPFQPHTVVEAERSYCTQGEENHGAESHGEEIHDETWAAE